MRDYPVGDGATFWDTHRAEIAAYERSCGAWSAYWAGREAAIWAAAPTMQRSGQARRRIWRRSSWRRTRATARECHRATQRSMPR